MSDRLAEIQARAESIPPIGYLVTEFVVLPERHAYDIAQLAREDVPFLLARITALETALKPFAELQVIWALTGEPAAIKGLRPGDIAAARAALEAK